MTETDGSAQRPPASAPPLRNRLKRFIQETNTEKKRRFLDKLNMLSGMFVASVSAVPFCFGKSNFLNIFFSYHPDSQAYFKTHPEFKHLFKSFTARNRINNVGDMTRLWSYILNIKQILAENIEGDFAELGVWRGNTASILAYFAEKSSRKVFLFDTYEGFSKNDLAGFDNNKKLVFSDTSIELVKKIIGENSTSCAFIKGHFPSTITYEHTNRKYAIVSLDCDLYDPMKSGLNFFYPLMPKGALFILHDYSSLHWDGSKKAIDEFAQKSGEYVILMPDKSGSAFIRKTK